LTLKITIFEWKLVFHPLSARVYVNLPEANGSFWLIIVNNWNNVGKTMPFLSP
jgi:hypothetical protein